MAHDTWPVLTNRSNLTMQFNWQDTQVFLQGVNESTMEAISSSQPKHLQSTHSIWSFITCTLVELAILYFM